MAVKNYLNGTVNRRPVNNATKLAGGKIKLSADVAAIFQQTVAAHKIDPIADSKTLDPNKSVRVDENGEKIKQTRVHLKIGVGMLFGDLRILRKLPVKKGVKPSLRERWKCECVCGKKIDVPKYYLIRKPNPKTHCGCKVSTIKSLNKREFLIYHMMHQRCLNPKHTSYNHYLKNGITIYEPWLKSNPDGFEKWFEHVKKAPTTFHTLDRIDNRKGYFPGNLRWATAEEQRANQGDRIGGYTLEEVAASGLTEEEFTAAILSGDIE